MDRSLLRIVAVLLLPALLADPALAMMRTSVSRSQNILFTHEALVGRASTSMKGGRPGAFRYMFALFKSIASADERPLFDAIRAYIELLNPILQDLHIKDTSYVYPEMCSSSCGLAHELLRIRFEDAMTKGLFDM